MSESEVIKGIRQAARQRARADEQRREATERLRDPMRQAQGAGVPIARIAREAELRGLGDRLTARYVACGLPARPQSSIARAQRFYSRCPYVSNLTVNGHAGC